MRSWEALEFCLLLPLTLYWTMLQEMRGTEKQLTNVYWVPATCQILRSENRPSPYPPQMDLWKECWDQEGVAWVLVLALVLIWMWWSVGYPEDQHLSFLICKMGGIKPCSVFSLGLSFGPDASAGNIRKKKKSFVMSDSTSKWTGLSCAMWKFMASGQTTLSINKIVCCFPHAAANFTKDTWLHCLWLKEVLHSHCH